MHGRWHTLKHYEIFQSDYMLWEMLHIDWLLFVWLRATSTGFSQRGFKSQYLDVWHAQATNRATHLAVVSAAPARSRGRKAPFWPPRGCKRAARTVRPACNTMQRGQGSVKNRKWRRHCPELSAGSDKHSNNIRIGNVPGWIRTRIFRMRFRIIAWTASLLSLVPHVSGKWNNMKSEMWLPYSYEVYTPFIYFTAFSPSTGGDN
jgi:hypothetical protein